MHRVRVRTKVAAATLAGLLVLTGCSRSTTEALQVGDETFDIVRIDEIAQPVTDRLAEGGVTGVSGEVRQSVVETTAFLEVARRYAQENGIAPPEPDYAGTAASLGAPEDDAYVRLQAEAFAYLTELREQAASRTPTDAETRKVCEDFIAVAGPGAATYEEIYFQLLEFPEYGKALTLRDELMAAADRYGVSVNPLYQPIEFGLLTVSNGQLTLVSLPLGEQGTGAVRTAG
jgi:hypothetical protein